MTPREEYHEYLQSAYWKQVSAAVKERAENRCQMCNGKDRLEAHHRTYEHRGREMEHLGDLICLCRNCHGFFHEKKNQAKPEVRTIIKTVVVEKVIHQGPPQVSPVQYRKKFRREMLVSELARKTGLSRSIVEGMSNEDLDFLERDYKKKPKAQRKAEKKAALIAQQLSRVETVHYHEIAHEMPDGDPITLSRMLLNRLRTNGAFTSSVLRSLGVPLCPEKGWVERLTGTTVSRQKYAEALAGRKCYAKWRLNFVVPDGTVI